MSLPRSTSKTSSERPERRSGNSIRFLLDENIPQSIGVFLKSRGHDVTYITEVAAAGSPDKIVAATAEQMDAVLLTSDHDFARIAPQIPIGRRAEFKKLHRIRVGGDAHQVFKDRIDTVEFEHARCAEKKTTLRMEIKKGTVRIIQPT